MQRPRYLRLKELDNELSWGFTLQHKQVLGMWFVAPASGYIDTLNIYMHHSFFGNTLDSVVNIRIHNSNIRPGNGPGDNFPGPCRSWGYWNDEADLDAGITPFPDEATDTTWVSTHPAPLVSFPPIGDELWSMVDFDFFVTSNSINTFPLEDFFWGGSSRM